MRIEFRCYFVQSIELIKGIKKIVPNNITTPKKPDRSFGILSKLPSINGEPIIKKNEPDVIIHMNISKK